MVSREGATLQRYLDTQAAVGSFRTAVVQPGRFVVAPRQPTVEVDKPPAPTLLPAEVPNQPQVSETKPIREPRGIWAEMIVAVEGFETRQKLSLEEQIKTERLLTIAFMWQ